MLKEAKQTINATLNSLTVAAKTLEQGTKIAYVASTAGLEVARTAELAAQNFRKEFEQEAIARNLILQEALGKNFQEAELFTYSDQELFNDEPEVSAMDTYLAMKASNESADKPKSSKAK